MRPLKGRREGGGGGGLVVRRNMFLVAKERGRLLEREKN